MSSARQQRTTLLPRFRLMRRGEAALGPGKADLLASIDETGSIAEAAKQMNMSYMRAWSLIKTMNRAFKKPVVAPKRGGKSGGGAALSITGKRVLLLYRQIEAQSEKAIHGTSSKLKSMLKQ
jgi:molybdate transport system regulatory protein